ncbi:MAG: HAD-IIIA family hydrolase [Flavitalea sp.]
MLDLSKINKDWTLFLDRDGVINVEKDPYILTKEEFEFYDGALEAIKKLSGIFKYVFVATNQRGVGRKLMTEEALLAIHEKMIKEVSKAGGKIDKIYFNAATENTDPTRKPNPGMAIKALKEYPDVIAKHTIMIGNNLSDMKFGRNAGFHAVLLTTTGTDIILPDPIADLKYRSLIEFANDLQKAISVI